jgi:hypothetical protein
MPSSISSSERPRRARHAVAHVAIGIGTAVAVAAVTALTVSEGARRMDIATYRPPPDVGSYYLAYDRGGQVDHHVIYHGIDREALARLRAAEVLFLGNSRLMFALETGALRAFFATRGLTYYVMGFGHTEQDDFPVRIIAKYDLRPSVVVVNADGFFWDGESAWAARTVRESWFDAWKLQVESEASHWVRRRLHAAIPHYVDLYEGGQELVVFRSRLDGTWFVANEFDEEIPFEWPSSDRHEPSRRSLQAAEAFKRELDARGARLILGLVPAPEASIYRAQVVAAHLGVPLVAPTVSQLATVDRSHLTAASSWRFERAFLAALAELLP